MSALATREEVEILCGCVWDSREECAVQARWLEGLGWKAVELRRDPAPRAPDGTLVYAVVVHSDYPERAASPGTLRYRPRSGI